MSSTTLSATGACTNFKLRKLLRVVSRLYDSEMAAAGLKGTQFSLLSALAKVGPVQPGALARIMDMDASTLTRNVRVIVNEGWAEQKPGSDSRSRCLVLTRAGHDKLSEARRHWKRAQQALNERLGLDRVASLHRMIDDGLKLLNEPELDDK